MWWWDCGSKDDDGNNIGDGEDPNPSQLGLVKKSIKLSPYYNTHPSTSKY